MSWTDHIMTCLRTVEGAADVYLNGQLAHGSIEQELDEMFGLDSSLDQCVLIGGDTYDWSLEIYICGIKPEAFVITPDQARTILSWGVNRFWINLGMTDEDKSTKTHEIYVRKGIISPSISNLYPTNQPKSTPSS